MSNLKLQCECGTVKGHVADVTPEMGNRIVCYCGDCRTFATHLGKATQTLDEAGGTEMFQIPPAKFQITEGKEHIACLKLSPKGLNRWYTKCCNTPIANTVDPGIPFFVLIHTFMASEQNTDRLIGPIVGNVRPEGATKEIPNSPHKHTGKFSLALRAVLKLIWWKITGQGSPNILFENKHPFVKPKILSDS